MKHLYFMRHGLSEMNALGIYSGGSETALTKKGEKQCHEAGKKLSKLNIDLIICSPSIRTLKSAEIVAAEIGYPKDKIVQNDLFIERDFGPLEGTDYNRKQQLDNIEGVEHSGSVIGRAASGLELIKSLDANNILIVSHGAVGRALRYLSNPKLDYYKIKSLDNAEVVELF